MYDVICFCFEVTILATVWRMDFLDTSAVIQMQGIYNELSGRVAIEILGSNETNVREIIFFENIFIYFSFFGIFEIMMLCLVEHKHHLLERGWNLLQKDYKGKNNKQYPETLMFKIGYYSKKMGFMKEFSKFL